MVFRPSSPTRIIPRLRIRNNSSNKPVDVETLENEKARGRIERRRGSCQGSVATRTSTRSKSTSTTNRTSGGSRLVIDLNDILLPHVNDDVPTSPNSSSSSLSSMDFPTTPIGRPQKNFEYTNHMSGLSNSKSTIDNNHSYNNMSFQSPRRSGLPPCFPASPTSNLGRVSGIPKSSCKSPRRNSAVCSPVARRNSNGNSVNCDTSYCSAGSSYFESPKKQVRNVLKNIQQLDDSYHSRGGHGRGYSTTGSISSATTPSRSQPYPYHPSPHQSGPHCVPSTVIHATVPDSPGSTRDKLLRRHQTKHGGKYLKNTKKQRSIRSMEIPSSTPPPALGSKLLNKLSHSKKRKEEKEKDKAADREVRDEPQMTPLKRGRRPPSPIRRRKPMPDGRPPSPPKLPKRRSVSPPKKKKASTPEDMNVDQWKTLNKEGTSCTRMKINKGSSVKKTSSSPSSSRRLDSDKQKKLNPEGGSSRTKSTKTGSLRKIPSSSKKSESSKKLRD